MESVLVNGDPDYERIFPQIVDALVDQGWIVIPEFFSAALMRALHEELLQHESQRELKPAKVGKGGREVLRRDIRGDGILWLDGKTEDQHLFLLTMEMLRDYLNRQLFLGLDELEAHFSLYPSGTGYRKHLDSFQNENLRKITVVTYLNPEWDSANGGELVVYNDRDDIVATVIPHAGTLVCFVSDEVPHEVAITESKRTSIAGWFRRREII